MTPLPHPEPVKMPDVPRPICTLSDCDLLVPGECGVYFFWKDGVVEYVGQSIFLPQRINKHHKAIDDIDGISWLILRGDELLWAEHYYIWLCQPKRNYGLKVDLAGGFVRPHKTPLRQNHWQADTTGRRG